MRCVGRGGYSHPFLVFSTAAVVFFCEGEGGAGPEGRERKGKFQPEVF